MHWLNNFVNIVLTVHDSRILLYLNYSFICIGKEDEARQFIQDQMAQPKGIDILVINGVDFHGKTALHNACANGKTIKFKN